MNSSWNLPRVAMSTAASGTPVFRIRSTSAAWVRRKNEELAQVLERANRVIKQIFDQEKYDLILQEVVFAGPRIDITKKVIDALNAGK